MLRMSNSNRKRIRKNIQQFDRSVSPPQFASQSAASRRVDGLPEPLSIPESEDQMNSARVRRATADVPSEPLLVPESEDSTDRLRRSPGDEFTKLLANLQALARVSTGVALEIGLVNQSIDPTIVIAELLRMGSVEPDDIIGLEDNVIKNALAEMDNLKKVPADGVVNMEDRLKTLDEMRKKASEFKNLPVKTYLDNYKASLKKVGDLGKLEKGLNDLITFIKGPKVPFDYLDNQRGILDENNKSEVIDYMETLYKSLETIEKKVKSFDSFSTPLKEAKRIVDDSKFIDVFLDENKLRTSLNDKIAKFDGPDFDTILADIRAASADQKNAEDLRTSLDIITKLLATKDRLYRQVYQFTSGLLRGVADLEQLSLSAGNEWIANRVQDNSTVAQSLEKAFASFVPLTTSLKNTEKAWLLLEKPENRKEVLDVINLLFQMTDGSSKSEGIQNTINELKICDDTAETKPLDQISTLEKIKDEVASLSKAVGKISDFQYIDQLKNLTTLKEHFNVASKKDENDKKELAKRTMSILTTDKDIKNLKENLEKLKQDLESFVGVAKNATSITKISLSDLEQHQKILSMDNYHKIFTCLESIKVNGPSVEEMIKFRQDIRKFSLPPNAKSTIDAIIGSGTSLSDAKTVAGKLKDVTDREVTSLKTAYEGMNDPALGMAVQGLVAINKVKNVRKQLEPLLELKSIPIGGLTPDQKKAIEDLQKLPEVFKSIDVFLNKSPELNVYRRKRSAADFKSIKPIFDAAAQIKGVEIDMKHLREALEALQQTTPNTYDEAVNTMDILETLDLNFARFSIGNATLGGLDDFFKKYGIEMSKVVASGEVNPRVGSNGSGGDAKEDGFPLWAILLISGVGTGVIATIIYALVRLICCKKKEIPAPVPSPVPVIPEPAPSPAPVPVTPEPAPVPAPVPVIPEPAPVPAPVPVIPEPAPVPAPDPELSDEDCVVMFRNVLQAIVYKGNKEGLTPIEWGGRVLEGLDKITNQMITEEEAGYLTERRYSGVYCGKETRAKMPDNQFIHCNEMEHNGLKILMAQGPMDGTEEGKVDTRPKHWMMIDHNSVAISIQLGTEVEGDTPKCAIYYPKTQNAESTYGKYRIKCLQVMNNLPDFSPEFTKHFTLYKLEYTNTETNVVKQTDILQFVGWPDHGVPSSPDSVLQIITFYETYRATTLIHCSAGIGRTGTVVAVKVGLEMCLKQKIAPGDIVHRVRRYRYGAIQTGDQLLYMLQCLLRAIMLARGIEFLPEYDKLSFLVGNIKNFEVIIENCTKNKKMTDQSTRKKHWEKYSAEMSQRAITRKNEYDARKGNKANAKNLKAAAVKLPATTATPGTSTAGTSTAGTSTSGTSNAGTSTPGTSTPGTSTPGTSTSGK